MTVVDLETRAVRRDPRDPVLTQDQAETLAARVMAAAADVARRQAVFLDLVGEFDACGAVGWWSGFASTAHWLAWACSISPGTAREHVRVARALRRMPVIREAFASGELTYSKVREITRVLQHTDRTKQSSPGTAGNPSTGDRSDASGGRAADAAAGTTGDEVADGTTTATLDGTVHGTAAGTAHETADATTTSSGGAEDAADTAVGNGPGTTAPVSSEAGVGSTIDTGPEGAALDAAAPDATAPDATAPDATAPDETALDLAAVDAPTVDAAAVKLSALNGATSDGTADKPAADKPAADKPAADKAVADKAVADKAVADDGSDVRNSAEVTDGPGFDEARMLEFARACTASQLARTVAGWRAAKGMSKQRRAQQRVAWVIKEDGSVHFTADLPPEEGAALIAAIQAGIDANQDPEPQPGDEQPEERRPYDQHAEGDDIRESAEHRLHRTRVEALVEIANHYLGSRPEDRSGEDRTMVVLEVNAAALQAANPVPTETENGLADDPKDRGNSDDRDTHEDRATPAASDMPLSPASERSRGNVSDPIVDGKCRVRGGAGIEPSDAERALCDSTVLGVIVDQKGVPLAVGREQRLVTKGQRRALMTRDGCCQYPGCGRSRHLKAHHRISWLNGGATDLDNLVLLCQRHHTRVHEDHIAIATCDDLDCGIPWRFSRPDGSIIVPTVAGLDAPSPWQPGRGTFRRDNDQLVADWEAEDARLRDRAVRLREAYAHVHNTKDPDARKVFPVGGGEGFNLANCVDVLFHLTEPLPTAA